MSVDKSHLSPLEPWIESGEVSASELAKYILAERSRQPSLQEHLLASGAIDPLSLLRAMRLQAFQGLSFRAACGALGTWSDRLQAESETYLRMTYVAPSDLVERVKKARGAAEVLPQTPPLEVDPENQPRFVEFLDQSQVLAITLQLARLAQGEGSRDAALREVFESVHVIRGAACLAGESFCESMFEEIESRLSQALREPSGDDAELAAWLSQRIEALWHQRQGQLLTQAETPPEPETQNLIQGETSVAARPRVLIVDDTRTVHSFVRDCLAGSSFELASAYDGSEALQLLKSDPAFDLVLLDWEMPRMSGPQLMAALASEGIRCPIVMMTAKNDPECIRSMIEAGAREFIMKPFTQDILTQKIELALESVNAA